MTRMEFMTKLGALLKELPDGERLEALRYYNEYFADAGEDQEAQVIEELGSPERIAKEVYGEERWEILQKQKTLKEEQEKQDEFVFRPGSYEEDTPLPKKKMGLGMKFLLLALFFPIWFPVLAVVFGVAFSVVMAILGVLIAVFVTGTVGILAGIAIFVFGIVRVIAIPSVGILMLGTGAVLLGVGILALLLMPLCWKAICWLIRSVVGLLRRIVTSVQAD